MYVDLKFHRTESKDRCLRGRTRVFISIKFIAGVSVLGFWVSFLKATLRALTRYVTFFKISLFESCAPVDSSQTPPLTFLVLNAFLEMTRL